MMKNFCQGCDRQSPRYSLAQSRKHPCFSKRRDVLTGLLSGLLAQASSKNIPVEDITATAAWWHAQAGILAAQERTELGVDAHTLTQYLMQV